jgi:ABC-2 type transport system ATP-binding protein
MTENFAIAVNNLGKNFGPLTAVDKINLQVKRGEIFGFLGPNGSGKTTTIRMLCGLIKPDCGDGHCLGYNILTESAKIKLEISYMTQHFSLYTDLSIYENLAFIANLYRVKNTKKIVQQTLESLGLMHRANQLAGTLSGGWKQRLSLSAALLHQPKLLLLDEPTAGVDPRARRDFWEQIHIMAREHGITTLVSTHYMDEAEQCHKLAYIAMGKILAQGTPQEIIKQANLVTMEATNNNTGSNIIDLAEAIKKYPGVEQIAIFGNSLHVTGSNQELLQQSIAQFPNSCNYNWRLIDTTLEDLFINLLPQGSDDDKL